MSLQSTSAGKSRIAIAAVLLLALGAGIALRANWRLPDFRAFLIARPDVTNTKPPQSDRANSGPENTIYSMLNGARSGDVAAYIASYGGAMETALRHSIAEKTESGFATYLKESNQTVQRIVVGEPLQMTDNQARVRVDYIYPDRQDIQVMYLTRQADGWKIVRIEQGSDMKP